MIHVVWELVVREGMVDRFERAYGADGDWGRLFRAHAGYRGTTLLRDRRDARRFVTVDRWETGAQYAAMRERAREEYERLDRTFAAWTESEREIGVFEEA